MAEHSPQQNWLRFQAREMRVAEIVRQMKLELESCERHFHATCSCQFMKGLLHELEQHRLMLAGQACRWQKEVENDGSPS